MATKYTGLMALPFILAFAVLAGRSCLQLSWRVVIRNAGVAAVVALLIAAPYYLRNAILLGCPIYPPPPGYAHFCTPKYFSTAVISQFHAYIRVRGTGMGRGLIAFLSLPYNLTYHTANFHGAGGIGLCPLAFGPIGLIAYRRRRPGMLFALVGFCLLIAWFITQQESRFLIPVYAIGSIISMEGWRYLRAGTVTRILVFAVIGTSVSYGMFMMAKARKDDVRAVFEPVYAAERQERQIPFRQSLQYLNSTPESSRVLVLDRSVPTFYLLRDYIKPIGQWGERTLPGAPNEQEAVREVRQWNVQYVLDVCSEVACFVVTRPSTDLKMVFEAPNQRVYAVEVQTAFPETSRQ